MSYKPSLNGCRLSPSSCNNACGPMLCSEFDSLHHLLHEETKKYSMYHPSDSKSWMEENFPMLPPSNTGATVFLNRTNQADTFRFMIEEIVLENL